MAVVLVCGDPVIASTILDRLLYHSTTTSVSHVASMRSPVRH